MGGFCLSSLNPKLLQHFLRPHCSKLRLQQHQTHHVPQHHCFKPSPTATQPYFCNTTPSLVKLLLHPSAVFYPAYPQNQLHLTTLSNRVSKIPYIIHFSTLPQHIQPDTTTTQPASLSIKPRPTPCRTPLSPSPPVSPEAAVPGKCQCLGRIRW